MACSYRNQAIISASGILNSCARTVPELDVNLLADLFPLRDAVLQLGAILRKLSPQPSGFLCTDEVLQRSLTAGDSCLQPRNLLFQFLYAILHLLEFDRIQTLGRFLCDLIWSELRVRYCAAIAWLWLFHRNRNLRLQLF